MNSQATAAPAALIDNGLINPKGLAIDRRAGLLYIADTGANAIFRYTLLFGEDGDGLVLMTTGVRLTIVENCGFVEYLAVDEFSNLFYSSPESNSINKVPKEVMMLLADGTIQASSLVVVSQKEMVLEQLAAQEAAAAAANESALPTDPPPVLPHIYSIYEGSMNVFVDAPGPLLAENKDLFWANQKNGTVAGTIVNATIDPVVVIEDGQALPFPATPLTNISDGAFGLAKTDTMMLFIRNGTSDGTYRYVSALLLAAPSVVVDFVKTMEWPTGLVWNGDRTAFVADETANMVYSIPIGQMIESVPFTPVVAVTGPHGLAVVSSEDLCYEVNKASMTDDLVVVDTLATTVVTTTTDTTTTTTTDTTTSDTVTSTTEVSSTTTTTAI
jgi:hypothetical protein